MEIVIKIPDKLYKTIISDEYGVHQGCIYDIIRHGIPLPKGHGELIERQVVIDKCNRLIEVEQKQGTDVMNYGRERVNSYEAILFEVESEYLVPTIIEADKAESEEV